MPIYTEEINELAHTLAYEFCVSVIEGNCVLVNCRDDPRDWWDLESLGTAEIRDEVRYLSARGLLLEHPDNARIVSILDEDS